MHEVRPAGSDRRRECVAVLVADTFDATGRDTERLGQLHEVGSVQLGAVVGVGVPEKSSISRFAVSLRISHDEISVTKISNAIDIHFIRIFLPQVLGFTTEPQRAQRTEGSV